VYDSHKDILELRELLRKSDDEIERLHRELYLLSDRLVQLKVLLKQEEILRYYATHPDESKKYSEELAYMEETQEIITFPYRKLKQLDYVESGYDDTAHLPYVLHENRRLYFPKNWTKDRCADMYRYYIEDENLLGGNYREKAPHQYQTDSFKVEDGDVLVDVGCAEALLSLDVIERVKKVYLIESDEMWLEPLRHTFEPYKDKVVIVNKLLSDEDSENGIRLDTLLKQDVDDSFFIKIDIEGGETVVIKSVLECSSFARKMKLACCTYHKSLDYENIKKILLTDGFSFDSSDGYLIFSSDLKMKVPYFRKGMIRAVK